MRAGYPGRMSAAVGSGVANFSPNRLSGLSAWYDFTKSEFLTLSATAITQALDRSGNGNHTAVQGTSTKRPTFASNQLNGLPLATFDGGDTLDLPSALYVLPNGAWTVFVVSKRNSETANANRLVSFTEGGLERANLSYGSAAGNVGFASRTAAGGGVASTGNTNTNYQILTAFRSGTTQSVQVNNGTATTNSGGLSESGIDAGHIGSLADASGYLTGGIAEILLYNRALTAGEIVQVNTYLSRKYAITIS